MKRYNSFVGYFKNKYGSRLQKVVIDAGFTCPNRDGKLSVGGCTFCDNNAFHPNYSTKDKSILNQINEGIEFHSRRYRNCDKFLAYFQAYTNTYDTLDVLKKRYEEALSHPKVVGIVIGTRPDCVDEEKLDYLVSLSKNNVVIIEYGIESCYNRTLERVNRCHTFEQAQKAVKMTAERGLDVGAHFILGLPGETREDMLAYAPMINDLPINSIKFHQLQIFKNTAMEKEYAAHPTDFVEFSLESYIDFFIDLLERLSPNLYIERFAGEVPPRFVSKTPWGKIRNPELIKMLEKRLEERNAFQGSRL
ncbi:MAG: TIGR01212 family radical SAM protein [Bacteroidales bacterium]